MYLLLVSAPPSLIGLICAKENHSFHPNKNHIKSLKGSKIRGCNNDSVIFSNVLKGVLYFILTFF